MATENFVMVGTSRMNSTGNAGTLTLPKHVVNPWMDKYGRDYAVFTKGSKIMFVPRDEVDIDE